MTKQKSERIEVIELKHKNNKEILSLKDKQEDKRYKHKVDYLKTVYDFKNAFIDKENKNKVDRLLKLYELKSKKSK